MPHLLEAEGSSNPVKRRRQLLMDGYLADHDNIDMLGTLP